MSSVTSSGGTLRPDIGEGSVTIDVRSSPDGRDENAGTSSGDGRAHRLQVFAWQGAAALVLLAGLLVVNRPGFLLFHTFAEIFTIVIAISTALVAWNAREYLRNDYLLFVGIGQSFVAVLDLLHMIAFPGMTVFAGPSANLSTQLWIAARLLGSGSLVAGTLFLRRRVPVAAVLGVFFALTALAVGLILTGRFPDAFDNGLTTFKVVSEVITCVLFAVAGLLLYLGRHALAPKVFKLILASILLRAVAGVFFTFYSDMADAYSFSGHYLRIISFYLFYKAVFESGIVRPYATVVHNLQQSERNLRGTVRELEAFSYSVSHDLRSPLAAISGFAQLLDADEGTRLTEQGRGYIREIRSASGRMADLIEDLLSFSRVSRAEIALETVDVTALAREICERLRARDPGRKVDVEIDDGMAAKADAGLLRIVLENLLGNSWKYTSKHATAHIEVRKLRSDREALFIVRDDGAGFDSGKAERIFQPFVRFHTAAEFDGSGIGLAIVARIIERHGGRIRAESEIEKGATIYFTLPER